MGRLADLKDQRNEIEWEHPDRVKIEGEINRIEQWCIDNKKGYITKLTTWYKGQRRYRPFGLDEENGFTSNGNFIVDLPIDRVVKAHYRCGTCGSEVLHFVLYDYCVKCNTKNMVVYVS